VDGSYGLRVIHWGSRLWATFIRTSNPLWRQPGRAFFWDAAGWV